MEQAKLYLEGEKEGLEVETSPSGEKALDLLEEDDFDAVVSDYILPEMNGLELLENLEMDIPFILFASRGAKEEVAIDALNMGAARYVRKGWNPKAQYSVLADAIEQEVKKKKTERELARENNLLNSMFENFPTALYIKNKEGEILQASRLYKETRHEEGHEQVIGKTDFDFFPNELAEETRKDEKRVMESEEPIINKEEHSVTSDGSHIYSLTSKAPVYDEKGEVTGTVGITMDITDWKEAEEELKRSKERFRKLFESGPDPVFLLDSDGTIQEISEVTCKKTGYDRDEIVGTKVQEAPFILEESREKIVENFRKRLKGEEPEPYEIEVRTKDGEMRVAEINVAVLQSEDEIEGVIGVARDVTEREETRRQLRLYKSAVEGSRDLMAACDENYRYLFANEAYLNHHGLDRAELEDKKVGDVLGEEIFEGKVKAKIDAALEGERVQYEMSRRHPDLGSRLLDINYYPLQSDGKIRGALAVMTDITEERLKEEEVREREEFLQSIFDSIQDGIAVLDEDLNIIEVNSSMEEKYEEKKPLAGKKCYKIHHDRESPCPDCPTIRAFEDGEPHSQVLKADEKWINLSAYPIEDKKGNVKNVIEYSKDITGQKEAEKKLRLYKLAVEGAEDQIAACDENYQYMFANEAFLDFHGLEEDEIIDRTVAEVEGEDLFNEEIKPRVDKCLEGNTIEYEMTYEHPERGERHLRITYYPLKDEEGEIQGLVANIRDLTE